jgi:hypothetical protein
MKSILLLCLFFVVCWMAECKEELSDLPEAESQSQ